MARVWDEFLTPQDRQDLERSGNRTREHHGSKPCLLLIDLYRWVFGDRPLPMEEAVVDWPGTCGLAGWEALPHIQRLLGEARRAGIPVVHTTGNPTTRIAHWSRSGGQGRLPEERWASRYDLVDEVKPVDGEVTIVKEAPSPFWGTPLMQHLTSMHIDTLFVAGESTSGCVRASVVDGATNRFDMIVVEEGVFDRHQLSHAANLFDMNQKYGDVVSIDRAIDVIGSLVDAAHVK